jgi:hypothetical protein
MALHALLWTLLIVLLVLASIWCALAILSEIEDLLYWLRLRWFP